MNRRHWFDDRSREDARDSIYGVVVDVSGADGQIHDFACAHEHALESRLMPVAFDGLNRLYDKRRRYFIDLAATKRVNDVALHAALFILIRHYAAALEVFPERPCIAQRVPARRLLTEFLSLAPGELTGLYERDLRPVAKSEISNPSTGADPKHPTFGAGSLYLKR